MKLPNEAYGPWGRVLLGAWLDRPGSTWLARPGLDWLEWPARMACSSGVGAQQRAGWLDLAVLGVPGRRFGCAWAVFSLISLRMANVS